MEAKKSKEAWEAFPPAAAGATGAADGPP